MASAMLSLLDHLNTAYMNWNGIINIIYPTVLLLLLLKLAYCSLFETSDVPIPKFLLIPN